MIVISKKLIPKGYSGLTIFPFIILKYPELRNDKVLLLHERIHKIQQLELFIIPFYVWYFLEFTIRFFKYRNKRLAYRNISFEREAYLNETDPDYLKSRSVWAFLKYI
ncbi:hypothetical protein [Mangrovimonas futianensis]|uniref:hypothetical protein n=1 Tax=Mangrovimonas futianensis TaxID=2895523 RepID=UPI001E5D9FB5|nr:hypothetical protein [Mangrovimonas futianensis]MCF1422513.1 hypothetical protein [Mangrovimonas futianensis]